MENILLVTQIFVALVLIILILIQAKGAGLGSAFGGSGMITRTRRGVDKLLFNTTIAFAFLFLLVSLLSVFLT